MGNKIQTVIDFFYMHFGFLPGYVLYLLNALALRIGGKSGELKALKDSHKGERCFFVGNGPSLTYDDLRKLKGEQTFGCNSLCLAFEKLGFKTTYYFFLDWRVYRQNKAVIDSYEKGKVFFRSTLSCFSGKDGRALWRKAMPFSSLPHFDYQHERTRKFSEKPWRTVYDGYTVVYAMMQIAAYMGYSEFYILGVDCDYTHGKNSNHFVGSETEHVTASEINYATVKMGQAFEVARKYADGHGIKVYNCSRGGKLDEFERKSLEEVLG